LGNYPKRDNDLSLVDALLDRRLLHVLVVLYPRGPINGSRTVMVRDAGISVQEKLAGNRDVPAGFAICVIPHDRQRHY